jgi:hypothetical protein
MQSSLLPQAHSIYCHLCFSGIIHESWIPSFAGMTTFYYTGKQSRWGLPQPKTPQKDLLNKNRK